MAAALLRATLPLWPPCTLACTCAALSGRRVPARFLRSRMLWCVFLRALCAQVIDNGLDLLMIKPLERM